MYEVITEGSVSEGEGDYDDDVVRKEKDLKVQFQPKRPEKGTIK